MIKCHVGSLTDGCKLISYVLLNHKNAYEATA